VLLLAESSLAWNVVANRYSRYVDRTTRPVLDINGSYYSIIRWNNRPQINEEKGRHHRHPARSWPKLPDASELEHASAMFRALGDQLGFGCWQGSPAAKRA
jgi:hypothetical protein